MGFDPEIAELSKGGRRGWSAGFPCWRGPEFYNLLAQMISVLSARSKQSPSGERAWGSVKVQLNSKAHQQAFRLLRKQSKGGKKGESNLLVKVFLNIQRICQYNSAFNI